MKKSSVSVITILCLLLFGCGNDSIKKHDTCGKYNNILSEDKKRTTDSIFSLNLMRRGDSLMKNIDRKEIEVYVQTAKGIAKVTNANWPDDIEKIYNITRKDVEPIVYIEVPYSESGDWNITYTYYFDKNGNTRAIKIVSSFFNSKCIDGALTEEIKYLYDHKFNLLSKIYYIHDEEGKDIQDTSECIFNYRFEFPKYSKISQVPLFVYLKESK